MSRFILTLLSLSALSACAVVQPATNDSEWRALTLSDFVNVNGTDETWSESNGVITCSGKPLGGARTTFELTDFELEVEWRHHQHAGNSGIFIWCPESAFTDLPAGQLPRSGIEVQVLDLGYEENWGKQNNEPSDWFTSHGDIFPVGESDMAAVHPEVTYADYFDGGRHDNARLSDVKVGKANSRRSFPTERLTKPAGEWNHYRITAIGGVVKLWVNGTEVNGGRACLPARGYLALESEGSQVEFRDLKLREFVGEQE